MTLAFALGAGEEGREESTPPQGTHQALLVADTRKSQPAAGERELGEDLRETGQSCPTNELA